MQLFTKKRKNFGSGRGIDALFAYFSLRRAGYGKKDTCCH